MKDPQELAEDIVDAVLVALNNWPEVQKVLESLPHETYDEVERDLTAVVKSLVQ